MNVPPTFVAKYETSRTTNPATLTLSISFDVGDVLVLSLGASNGGGTFAITNAGGLSWTLRQSIHVSTSWADAWVWTTKTTVSGTVDITVTKTGGSAVWGYSVFRYSGSNGIGVSSKANISASSSAGVSLGLTTISDNSVIAFLNTDWDVVSGASRQYLNVNGAGPIERTYVMASPYVTYYEASYPDVGPAGLKTVGMSSPLGQKYSAIAVEILGMEAEVGSGITLFDGVSEEDVNVYVYNNGVEIPISLSP